MSGTKESVINWIRSGMDYNKGISLLIEITHNQRYFSQFTGSEKLLATKLAYEILKAAKLADFLTWKDFIRKVQSQTIKPKMIKPKAEKIPKIFLNAKLPELKSGEENKLKVFVPEIVQDETIQLIFHDETPDAKPLSEYPAVIRRVIHEYASLFQERSKTHSAMAGMPESNAPAVCSKRAEMFEIIKSLSERLEFLHATKEAFDKKGIIPKEKDIFPPEKRKAKEVPLNEEELKWEKKKLQSGNSKDNNILDYQSQNRSKGKNPLPPGIRRTEIERRIQERNKKIEEIETFLLKIK